MSYKCVFIALVPVKISTSTLNAERQIAKHPRHSTNTLLHLQCSSTAPLSPPHLVHRVCVSQNGHSRSISTLIKTVWMPLIRSETEGRYNAGNFALQQLMGHKFQYQGVGYDSCISPCWGKHWSMRINHRYIAETPMADQTVPLSSPWLKVLLKPRHGERELLNNSSNFNCYLCVIKADFFLIN